MARIALTDKQMFIQLMSATVGTLRLSEAEIWQAVLDEWWRRVRDCPFRGLSSFSKLIFSV